MLLHSEVCHLEWKNAPTFLSNFKSINGAWRKDKSDILRPVYIYKLFCKNLQMQLHTEVCYSVWKNAPTFFVIFQKCKWGLKNGQKRNLKARLHLQTFLQKFANSASYRSLLFLLKKCINFFVEVQKCKWAWKMDESEILRPIYTYKIFYKKFSYRSLLFHMKKCTDFFVEF